VGPAPIYTGERPSMTHSNVSDPARTAADLSEDERRAVRNLSRTLKEAPLPQIAASLIAKNLARRALGGLILTDYGEQVSIYV